MDWISLIGPALVAAGVSGAIAVVGSIVTTRTVRRLRADRLEFDFALSAHKFNLDKALAEIRAAADRHDHDLSELKRTTELAERAIADFHQVTGRTDNSADILRFEQSLVFTDGGSKHEGPRLLKFTRRPCRLSAGTISLALAW